MSPHQYRFVSCERAFRAAVLVLTLSIVAVLVTACGQPAVSEQEFAGTAPDDQPVGQGACAIALAQTGNTDASDPDIARWQRAVQRVDSNTGYLERLGWAYVAKARSSFDSGFYVLAEQTAFCLDSKTPNAPEALLLRGHVLHQMHRFAEAEISARRLVSMRGLPFDHGLFGDVLMEQGKLAEAVTAYQAMMDQKPGPEAYARAAHLRWLTGDLDGAIEVMYAAVQGIDARAPDSSAWNHVRLAVYLEQAGEGERAAAVIEAALRVWPDYPPALLERGRRLLAQGEGNKAGEVLERATSRSPLPEYWWAFAEALRFTGRDREAATVERELHARGAIDDPRTYALYLATVGEDLPAAVRLARAELARRADAITLDTAAWALYRAGAHRDARALSRRALAVGLRDARMCLHAALIAQAVGAIDEAHQLYAQAAALQSMLLPSERMELAKNSADLGVRSLDAGRDRPRTPSRSTETIAHQ